MASDIPIGTLLWSDNWLWGNWPLCDVEPFVTASNGYMHRVCRKRACAFQLGSWCNHMGWVWQGLKTQRYENAPGQLGDFLAKLGKLAKPDLEPFVTASNGYIAWSWDPEIWAILPLCWSVLMCSIWWKSDAYHKRCGSAPNWKIHMAVLAPKLVWCHL